MNRRRYLFTLFRASAGSVTGIGLWTISQMASAVAFRPLPDDHFDGSNDGKRHRKGRGNGNGKGNDNDNGKRK